MEKPIYMFEANLLNGKPYDFKQLENHTIIIVNTASKCGFTPQYEGLEKIYEKYKDQGLLILGFPCNQFGQQEKGDSTEISEFCQVNYGVTFPIFEKIDVNGTNAHPLYKYLKKSLGGFLGSKIKWNFTKFVVDKNGQPIKRFSPLDKPEVIEKYLLEKQLIS